MKRLYKYMPLVLACAGFLFFMIGITHEDLWYDETYSAAMINNHIIDICRITLGDSHPPLYYIMLKLFAFLFGNSVFSLRLFSALGAFAILLIGAGPIRKICGTKLSCIFIILTASMPMVFSYAQEVRMYTWAAFFVTTATVYGWLAFKYEDIKYWVILALASLCAAYTHYYAAIAIVALNFSLFVLIIIKRKKVLILSYLAASFATVALYFPWIIFLYRQVKRVSSSFWISPISRKTLMQILVFPFNHKFTEDYIYLLPFLLISIILGIFGFYKSIKKDRDTAAFIGFFMFIYILTLTGGVIISYLLRPLLIPRYMLVVIPAFILMIANGINVIKGRVLTYSALAIAVLLCSLQNYNIITTRYNGNVRETVAEMKKHITKDDVFIHIDGNTYGVFCYYFPENKNFLYQPKGSVWYSDYRAFKKNGSFGDSTKPFIKNKSEVYLVIRDTGNGSVITRKFAIDIKNFALIGPVYKSYNPDSWFAFSAQKIKIK